MQDLPPHIYLTKVHWGSSNVQYAVLFLQDRMLFVKTGGQFGNMEKGQWIGAIAGGILGGAVGGVLASEAGRRLESKLRKDKTDPRDKKLATISQTDIDNILKLDKKNFEVLYQNINMVTLKKSIIGVSGARIGVFTLDAEQRKKESFDIAVNQDFKGCVELVKSFLPDKVKS